MYQVFRVYTYFLFLFFIGLIKQVYSGTSVSPTWLPNSYFETQQFGIKTDVTTTFNSSNPISKTIPFTKTYTAIPQLAFGIKNYRGKSVCLSVGKDKLIQQNFAISRTGITLTDFSVFTLIQGTTNIRIFTIIYLAVDRAFPYHLNTFNDIQANFSTGLPLSNISGTQTGNRQYTNTINYTVLANTVGSSYTKFGANLAKNNVALYLCAIFNKGLATKPVNFSVIATVINAQQFSINIKIFDGYQIDLLRFSMVITDIADIQSSGLFTIQFKYQVFDATKINYIPIPKQFAPATFIGLLDFSAANGNCGLQFNWQLDLANDRIIVNASVTYQYPTIQGLYSYRLVVFYVKTWNCPAPNYFFNLGSNLCDDYCAKYMYGNAAAAQCQPCQLGCYSCINGPSLGCTSCNPLDNRQSIGNDCLCKSGFYSDPSLISSICLTCASAISNCQSCQVNGLSQVICDTCGSGYALLGNTCTACAITNCVSAITVSGSCFCSTCNGMNGFVADGLGSCNLCSNYIANCQQCPNQSQCSVCDAALNYFTNSSTFLCQQCALTNCITCSSLSQCSLCHQSIDYFLNPATKLCQKCALSQCTDCLSSSQCSQCNEAQDYFLNPLTKLCEHCSLPGCLDCLSMTQCDTCDYQLDYFFDPLLPTNLCIACTLSNCINCGSLTQCIECDQNNNYFLDAINNNNQCIKCNLIGCTNCQALTTCLICDTANNYGLMSNGTCAQCPFTCLCDGYVLPKYNSPQNGNVMCSTLCGDGYVRGNQSCDDGNVNNGDGCSSLCAVQQAWSCNSNTQHTCCNLQSSKLLLQINKILKISDQNSLQLQLQIKPEILVLTQDNLENYATLTIKDVPLYNQRRQYLKDQKIIVTYDYNQSIHNKKGTLTLSIKFHQPDLPSCVVSAIKTIQILAQANNNLPFMFYTQKDLQTQRLISLSVESLQLITYGAFFISLVPSKIIGLELIGVLQLAYFSLAQQQNVNIMLEPFMKMSNINGFNNVNVTRYRQSSIPDQISSLGVDSLFLNNCNIMLGVIVSQMLIAGVLFAISHAFENFSKKLATVAKYLIKQGFITLMMFNVFNIAFGTGIHFQYADPETDEFIVSSLAALTASGLVLGSCVLVMFTDAKQFGQFKDKMKPSLLCQLYFVFSLMYRYILGYYIAVQAQYTLSSLIIVGFSLIFIVYNLVNLPFKSAYHNYRANVCHLTQLIVLFVTNYYDSLVQNDPMQQKTYQFTAAQIQIGSIYVCLTVSTLCLAFDLYQFIKSKFISSISSKVKNSPLNSRQSLPSNSNHIHHTNHTNQINNTFQDLKFNQFHDVTFRNQAFQMKVPAIKRG